MHDVMWIMILVLSKYHYETFNNDVHVGMCCIFSLYIYIFFTKRLVRDKQEISLQQCEREKREIMLLV